MADPGEKIKSVVSTDKYAPGFEEPLEDIDDTVKLSPRHILQGTPISDEPGPNITEKSAQQQKDELRAEVLAAQAEIDKAAEDGKDLPEVIARRQHEFEVSQARFAPETLSMIGDGDTAGLASVRNELEKEKARQFQATLRLSPSIAEQGASAIRQQQQLQTALRDNKGLKRENDLGRDREAKLVKENAELRNIQRSRDQEVVALRRSCEEITKKYNDNLVRDNKNVPSSKPLVEVNQQLSDRVEKLKQEKERSEKEIEGWKGKYKSLEFKSNKKVEDLEQKTSHFIRGTAEAAQVKLIDRLKRQLESRPTLQEMEQLKRDLAASRAAHKSVLSEKNSQADVQAKNQELRQLRQKFAAINLTSDQEKTRLLLEDMDEKDKVIGAMEEQIRVQDEATENWPEEVRKYEKIIQQLRQDVEKAHEELERTKNELETANRKAERAAKEVLQQAEMVALKNLETNEQSETITKLIREMTEAKLQLSVAQTIGADSEQKAIEFEKKVILANISSVKIHLNFMVLQRAVQGFRDADTAAAQQAATVAVHEAEELYETPDLVAEARYWRGIVRYYSGDQRIAFEEFKAVPAEWQGEGNENIAAWLAAADPDTSVEVPKHRDGYRAGLGFSPREFRTTKLPAYQFGSDVKLRPHLYVRQLDEKEQRIFDTIEFDNGFDYDSLTPSQQALFSFEPPIGDILPPLPEDHPVQASPRYGSADLPRRSEVSRPVFEYGGPGPTITSPSSTDGSRESRAPRPSFSPPEQSTAPAPPPEPSRLTEITTDAALHIQFLVAQLDEASQRIRRLESSRESFQAEQNVRRRREEKIIELRREVTELKEELEYLSRPWWWRWGRAR
ncbi:hypothetical protein ACMFMG_007416 [Clarireedia jacksonii]